MFRSKDRMLNCVRSAKKKNNNKEGKEIKVNYKDLYSFETKGIQQQLVKEGIRVHKNDIREIRHSSLSDLTEDQRKMPIGNTTYEVLLDKINKNESEHLGFGNCEVIAKTHDMTRWNDNKKKTLDRKRNRNDKIHSQLFES